MRGKRFLAIFFLAPLFFLNSPTVAYGQKEASPPVSRRQREKVQEQKELLKEKQEERREKRKAKISALKEEKIRFLFTRLERRFNAALNRLERLINRIESRLVKIEAEGEDTRLTRESLTQAKEKVKESQVNLALAKSSLENLAASDNPKEDFAGVRQSLKNAKQSLIETHRLLVFIIKEIKGLRIGTTKETTPASEVKP